MNIRGERRDSPIDHREIKNIMSTYIASKVDRSDEIDKLLKQKNNQADTWRNRKA